MADQNSPLRTSRGAPTLFDQVQVASQLSSEDRYNLTNPNEGEFKKGLRTGAAGLSASSFANQALSQERAGDARWEASRDSAFDVLEGAAPYAARVSSLRDVGSLADAGDYAANTIGQGVMSMAPVLATALVTRGRGKIGTGAAYAGGALTAYGQEKGEAALGQYGDETLAATDVVDRDNAATAKGAVNAALESVVPGGLATSVLRRPFTSALKEVGKDALKEGATETAQTVTGLAADQYLDPGREVDGMELLDAFAGGTLTGGTVSGAARLPAAAASSLASAITPKDGGDAPAPIEPAPAPVEPTPSEPQSFADSIIQRMGEASMTATDPVDFLRKAFNDSAESEAEPLIVGDNDPTLAGATPEETEANLLKADQLRAERAAAFAQRLIDDPKTPDPVKQKIVGMGGAYADAANQQFLGRTFLKQQAETKIESTINDVIELGSKLTGAVKGKFTKQNMQDTTPTEQAAFNKLVFDQLTDEAKASPEVRKRLPELANTMLAFAARTGELDDGDVDTLSSIYSSFSLFQDVDALTEQLSTYANLPRLEDSFLARAKRTNTAQRDAAKPNSFLYTALTSEAKDTLRSKGLSQLAKLVDNFTALDSEGQGDKVLAGLATAFGSQDAARAVLDYYAGQNQLGLGTKVDTKAEGMTQQDTQELTGSYRQPNPNRPFFRGRDDELAKTQLKDTGGANSRIGSLAEYTKLKGESVTARAKGVRADLVKRIEAEAQRDTASVKQKIAVMEMQESLTPEQRDELLRLKVRKTENRPGLKLLRDELKAQDDAATLAKKEGRNASEARLSLYDTVLREETDTMASDENVAKFRRLLDQTPDPTTGSKAEQAEKKQRVADIKATAIGFKRKGQSKPMFLSAESMVHSAKNKGTVAQRFADAVASVLARGDIEGLAGDISPDTIIVRGKNGSKHVRYRDIAPTKASKDTLPASKKGAGRDLPEEYERDFPLPDYDEFSTEFNAQAGEEGRYADDGAAQIGYEERKIEVLEERLAHARAETKKEAEAWEDRLEFARSSKSEMASDLKARAEAAREDARKLLSTLENQLKNSNDRLNELINQYEARYFEDDTGLPIGVEKRGAKPSTMDPIDDGPEGVSVMDREAKDKIKAEILRIRGPQIKVLFGQFAQIGASGEFSMDDDKTNRLIKIAMNAINPTSVAWHESLHDFMAMLGGSKEERQLKRDLLDAAQAPQVMTKLRELLKGHPKAITQIENDKEERLAYMYQFWAEGKLTLGPTGTNIFTRIAKFLREALGVLSQDEKITKLLDALHTGKFADQNLVSAVLEDLKAETIGDKVAKVAGPIYEGSSKLFTAATDRLRDTNIDALGELADMFHREPGHEAGGLPFLQARSQQVGKYLNKLQGVLDKTTATERRAALENMLSMKAPSSKLERDVAALLEDIRVYMDKAGVKRFDEASKEWVPMGVIKNYFPRNWDKNVIRNRESDFVTLLTQYVGAEQARATYSAIVNGDGAPELQENKHNLGFTPFMQAVQDRRLNFINENNAALFTPFMNKDMLDALTTYIQQAVHRGEYAKTFGNAGEVIQTKLKKAKEQGASNEELDMATNAVMAMEGTLGHDFNPRLKELMSGIMTYQNIVLLPLALFSSLIDPLGVAMRSNDMKEAFHAFSTGLQSIAKDLAGAVTGNKKTDEREEMAKLLGIIDEQNMLEAMGHVYNSMHMSKFMKKVNSAFFRGNGMETWNRGMRVAATSAAQRFIVRNTSNDRYMKELGITKADVFEQKDGTIALTQEQLVAAGATPAEAEKIEKRIQAAVFKFVDGAVLRPNAAHRPIWGSDPRFQLIFHLKQFTYSFHNTILKRVGEEMQHGNAAPVLILLSYVPFMLASDIMKGSLTGTLQNGTDLYDVISRSVARSGIMGLGTFGADAAGDASHGSIPGSSFLGPTFDHLMTILDGIFGNTSLTSVVERSVPGGAALRGVI